MDNEIYALKEKSTTQSPIITLFLYATLSLIIFIYASPRYSLFLFPMLCMEIINSINLVKKITEENVNLDIKNETKNKTLYYILSSLGLALLAYFSRFIFVRFKIYNTGNLIFKLLACILSLFINTLSFLHGALLHKIFSNLENTRWIYKLLALTSLLIAMVPLGFVSSNNVMEKLYVSNLFVTICGCLWGVHKMISNDIMSKTCRRIKLLVFVYSIFVSFFVINDHFIWNLNQY